MTNCLVCGKPLGSSSGLCYSCQQDGHTLDDAITVDDDVVDRVERYMIVASIRCSDCGDLHGEVTVEDESYTADSFGLESVEEWELEMDKEEAWIEENAEAVRKALHVLEPEWPQTSKSIRKTILP